MCCWHTDIAMGLYFAALLENTQSTTLTLLGICREIVTEQATSSVNLPAMLVLFQTDN